MLRHQHERVFIMVSRRNLVQYACPICTTDCWYAAEKAGQDTTCRECNSTYPVPTGLTPMLVTVGTSPPRRKLTPEETEEFYASHPEARAMVHRRTVPAELVPEPFEQMPEARYPVSRQDDDKKVKVGLGKWIGMEVDVDGKTRNAMATTFLGGLLVALGAIIFSRFGVKSKS